MVARSDPLTTPTATAAGPGPAEPVPEQFVETEGVEAPSTAELVLDGAQDPVSIVVAAAPAPRTFGPEDVWEHFLKRRTANTLDAYRKDLRALCGWKGWTAAELAGQLLASRASANALCLEWLEHMKDLAPATQARRLSTLRGFVVVARQLGVVEWTLDIEGPKVQPYRDTRGPGGVVAQQMIDACGPGLKGLRDYALLLVALTLGLRRFEIAELCTERLDRAGSRVLVKGKGGKWAWAPLPVETLQAIDAWMSAWAAAHGSPADSRVFRSLSKKRWGQPLKPKTVWDVVSALGDKVGVKVWPHGIRHTAITSFLDETDGNVRAAQGFARHSNVQTTMRYDDNRQDLARDGAESLAKRFARKVT